MACSGVCVQVWVGVGLALVEARSDSYLNFGFDSDSDFDFYFDSDSDWESTSTESSARNGHVDVIECLAESGAPLEAPLEASDERRRGVLSLTNLEDYYCLANSKLEDYYCLGASSSTWASVKTSRGCSRCSARLFLHYVFYIYVWLSV